MPDSLPDSPLSILLVDDDRLIIELEQAWLSGEGYVVKAVRDGNEALEVLDREDIDIVIADQVMPGMDGITLLRTLRGPGRAKIPYFILVTGDPDPKLLNQAFLDGADDFIPKPMQRIEFIARLRSARRVVALGQDLERRVNLSFDRRLLENGAAEFREVVATLAHDLRTPIGALRTTAETLAWSSDLLLPEVSRLVTRIVQISIHLAETVRDVTDAFVCDDSDGATWTRFDLRSEVRGAAELVRGALRPGVELVVVDKGPCDVVGNPHGIRRLCVNILSNALRATKTGKVNVGVEIDPGNPSWVTLKVTDSGEGIPAEVLPLLGEPLALSSGARRRHFSVQGAGLGLAICRRVTARHGGRLRIETSPGKGTEVSARFRTDMEGVSKDVDFAPLDTVLS
ncbi:MAG: hybrid sensor histidine kinase/response regulator [Fibrobacterota bacterium]